MSHTSRRRTTAALAGVTTALATTATLSLVAVGGAEAAEPAPYSPIVVHAPDKITVESYGRGDRVYSNFGLAFVADQAPFEVWSTRAADYDTPISTSWKSGAYGGTLPEGTVSTFRGLDGFVSVDITRVSDGSSVLSRTMDSCLNTWSAQRIRPDASAYSPYPQSCPWNPYTLGSVMGIQQGWAAPLTEEWESSYRLKPGRYDVTAAISPTWRTALGISDVDGVKTVRVKVVDGNGRVAAQPTTGEGVAPRPAAHRPSGPSALPAPDGPAPDLRSLPAFGIGIGGKGTTLRFGATTWNGGDSPLVVDGFRSETDPDAMDAYQYFFDQDGNQVGYQPVGEMHWHAANHNHWHFEDFAQYNLLAADMSQVVKSTKQSWCLANTDAVDFTVDGADWRPENTDLSTACGGYDALSIREVLSSGSGDTYYQYRAGQAFRIKNVPNGIYYISVEANPLGNLYELDETNNDSLRKIRIGGKGETRWVRTFQVGLVQDDMGGF
ncbi:lysyl oxidase family protein [Nocardioides taihuensis]|uniref:Lysyl oxidase family protein n=1 Tax=Nocardioides taihuensis TaxID=1835606 RepID=A0ABW0BM71_9ACTN